MKKTLIERFAEHGGERVSTRLIISYANDLKTEGYKTWEGMLARIQRDFPYPEYKHKW